MPLSLAPLHPPLTPPRDSSIEFQRLESRRFGRSGARGRSRVRKTLKKIVASANERGGAGGGGEGGLGPIIVN